MYNSTKCAACSLNRLGIFYLTLHSIESSLGIIMDEKVQKYSIAYGKFCKCKCNTKGDTAKCAEIFLHRMVNFTSGCRAQNRKSHIQYLFLHYKISNFGSIIFPRETHFQIYVPSQKMLQIDQIHAES
jgi:hypothetical protein